MILEHSLDAMVESLGRDGPAWRLMATPIVAGWNGIISSVLGPQLRLPAHPLAMAPFGLGAVWPATRLARLAFRTERARAVFAGLAGHAMADLRSPLTSSFALMFIGAAHRGGWPMAAGGSQAIADA
ncbi:MAG: FAD-dependent oxidoreductase, partial [Actinomycetota bacterium]